MTDLPLIDRTMLDDLAEAIGFEGTRSVLELFIGETGAYLAAIAEGAAQSADPELRDRARRAAHSLKSGAAQIGAAAVAAAAESVERAVVERAADLAPAATALQTCAAETMETLRRLLNSE